MEDPVNSHCTGAPRPKKNGTGYPIGWGALKVEPEPGTQVPADTCTLVPGYPSTRVTMQYLLLFCVWAAAGKVDTGPRLPRLP